MTDAEYIATLEQALQKKTIEWRHAYAAYARCAARLEELNRKTPVIACYIGYDYDSEPTDVCAFNCRADAEEYLLSLWEEDEYRAFCRTVDELGAEDMEKVFNLMYDHHEEDFECWFIFDIEHNFM